MECAKSMFMSSQPALMIPDKGHSLTYQPFLEHTLHTEHCAGDWANKILKHGHCHE